jgi:DivIVA domain-containing protein
MPTGDLDMPLRPSAQQIRRRDFGTVRRGYDPQEVRAYLGSIARMVESLERELSQLREEAASVAERREQMAEAATTSDAASPTEDPYDALSKRFAALIEMADQEAERILEKARSEAKRAIDEARGEADRIRVDAQARAEETRQEVADLLRRAKMDSDRALSGLAERRRNLVSELAEMRGKLVAVAEYLAPPIEEAAQADADHTDLVGEHEDAGDETDEGTPLDPRYKDLWVDKEEPLQIPDLAPSIDLEEREE